VAAVRVMRLGSVHAGRSFRGVQVVRTASQPHVQQKCSRRKYRNDCPHGKPLKTTSLSAVRRIKSMLPAARIGTAPQCSHCDDRLAWPDFRRASTFFSAKSVIFRHLASLARVAGTPGASGLLHQDGTQNRPEHQLKKAGSYTMKRWILTFVTLVALSCLGAGTASAQGFGFYWGGGHAHIGHGHYGHGHVHYPRYHDTSHYHYHPGYYQRHGGHYHYVPGHYDLHRSGHWHH
jgi:hypothetical protein